MSSLLIGFKTVTFLKRINEYRHIENSMIKKKK